jgi:hypothetical protein
MQDQEILTKDDAEFLNHHESGLHLIQEIKAMLNKSRLEVDFITVDGLPVIQGRISAFKSILTLLGSNYE